MAPVLRYLTRALAASEYLREGPRAVTIPTLETNATVPAISNNRKPASTLDVTAPAPAISDNLTNSTLADEAVMVRDDERLEIRQPDIPMNIGMMIFTISVACAIFVAVHITRKKKRDRERAKREQKKAEEEAEPGVDPEEEDKAMVAREEEPKIDKKKIDKMLKEIGVKNPEVPDMPKETKDALFKAVGESVDVKHEDFPLIKETLNVATLKKGVKLKDFSKKVHKALCLKKDNKVCKSKKPKLRDVGDAVGWYMSQPKYYPDKTHTLYSIIQVDLKLLKKIVIAKLLGKFDW